MDFVYVVSDIGNCSPTLGIVLALFSDLDKAKDYCLKRRNEGIHEEPEDIGISKIYIDTNVGERIDF